MSGSRIHPGGTADREPAHAAGGGRRLVLARRARHGVHRRARGDRHRAPRARGRGRPCRRDGQRRRGPAVGDDVSSFAAGVPVVRPLTALTGAPGLASPRSGRARVEGGLGRLAARQPGPARVADARRGRVGSARSRARVRVRRRRHRGRVRRPRTLRRVPDRRRCRMPLARISPGAPLGYAYRAGAWVVAVRARIASDCAAEPTVAGAHAYHRGRARGSRWWTVSSSCEFRAWGEARPRRTIRDAASVRLSRSTACRRRAICETGSGRHVRRRRALHDRAGRRGAGQSRLVSCAPEADGVVRFEPGDFDDGPWCPYDGSPEPTMRTCHRISRVDIRLRVEVQSAEFRGPAGALFTRGGTAARQCAEMGARSHARVSVALGR